MAGKHTLSLENFCATYEEKAFTCQNTRGRSKRTYEAGYYVYNYDELHPINYNPLDRDAAIALAKEEQAKRDERDAARKAQEEAKRQEEEARAQLIAEKGPLATERQVAFALDLINAGRHEESNTLYHLPRTRAQLETMGRKEISLYIDSLLGKI